jgi:hypothetical protein
VQNLLFAQRVSGTIMPIIRSSRVFYRWLLPVAFGALVFKLSVWCGAEGYVSGLRAAGNCSLNAQCKSFKMLVGNLPRKILVCILQEAEVLWRTCDTLALVWLILYSDKATAWMTGVRFVRRTDPFLFTAAPNSLWGPPIFLSSGNWCPSHWVKVTDDWTWPLTCI